MWLDRGDTRRLDKGFAHFEAWRDTVLEEEEREQHKLGRQIVREEHWLRYGVTARRKRNMRRLGELHTMRRRFRGHRGAEGVVAMAASDSAESGKLVIEAKSISKSFGDLTVVKGFSTRIQRGDRLGLVGPNGAGKTTLLKLLTGELAPDEGTVRLGTNLEIAALDQKREFDPDETLAHFLTDGRGETVVVNGEERHVVSYMKDFLFKPEQARTPMRELSGGERARLILARVLARPANLLVLDEPTNDLDMETLDLLAGARRRLRRHRDPGQPRPRLSRPHGDQRFWRPTAAAAGSNMPAATPTCWPSAAAPSSTSARCRARAAPDAAGASPGKPNAAAGSSKKLSYKQKFALESLPRKMEAAAISIGRLEARLADPRLFSSDPAAFARTAAALEAERAVLASLEEEWLELEMLREAIECG